MKLLSSRIGDPTFSKQAIARYAAGEEDGDDSTGRRSFYRGTAGAFLVQVGGAGLGLLSHFIVARILGAKQYGAFALTLTWVSTIAVLSLLGQDNSVVKFLPGYVRHGDSARMLGLRRGASALVFATSVAIALIGAVVVYLLPQRIEPLLQRTMWAGCILLPVLTQLQLSGALHKALKRAISYGAFNNILRPVVLIALVLAFSFVLGDRLTAPIAIIASSCAALISFAVSSVLLFRAWPSIVVGVKPIYEWGAWSKMGLHLSLMSVIVVAGNRLDVLLLGALGGTSQVGPYYVAVQMAGFALYALYAGNVVLAPLIAERYGVQDLAGLQIIARRAARIGFGVALIASLFFALTGKWLLGLFGAEFPAAYAALLVLLLGYSISTSFGEVAFMMAMTAYQKHAALFVALGVVINCVVGYVLIPRFGMIGAATGAALAIITWRALAMRFVMRRLKINPSILGTAA